jgi:hypothetical protein
MNVLDAQTGQETLPLKGGGVVFSPDGHRLAGSGKTRQLKIRDATPLPEKP